MATEAADIPDPMSLTKRDGVEDKELTSELSYTIVNEVPMEEEKKKVESSVNQPPETIEILEKTEHMQVVNGKEVPNVNVVDEGNVGNIEGEIFLKSSPVSDEKPMRNTEENQSITKEELSDLQDEKGCITDKNIIVEGSYAKAGPDVGDNLEEKTTMAYEDRSQEIVELSEKMKDVTTIDDEVQNKNFESSFVEKLEDISFQKVDNLETSKEESEAGMKYIVKESPDEADDQNEILRNIATTDRNLSTTGKDDENPEPKAEESMRESEDLTPPEALTMECKHERLMVLAGEDNAEDKEQEKTETSKHEKLVQKNEPAKANLGSPLDVTSEENETPSPNEYAETMTNIEEQRPVGIPQEILGETRQDEAIIADDINKNENPEAKNVSTVDLDEKTRSIEVEIPSKNGNELYVTHPPIEETVKVEGEKQDEVSMSESGGRLHEVFEVPMEEEKRVNETFEASKSPEGIILEHTSTEGALNMEVTLATSELNINPEKGCELNSEKEIKEINAEENIKEETEQKEKAFDTEIQIATKSDDNEKSTTEEVVPVKNTTLCTGEEEYHHDREDKNETHSSKEASPKLDTGDQGCRTSNETKNINDQIINEEAIQVYEDVKIADRGENTEKEMENEEHTVMDRSPESNGKHTTKCSQENETDAEKQKAKIGEELETTNKSEVIEKQVLAEENRVQDGLTVSTGEEFGTESSKEDDMTTKMSKDEVLEILQTADGSANIGIQTKKEYGTSKDKFVARDGEETKNECSYGKDEEKESDIEISLMNEDLNAQSITRSSEEETAQKESTLDIVENSSSVPEISEKGIKEEKDDSQVTMVAEETSLTEAEEKYKMPVDSSDMVSVEMGLLTTETSEMESNDIGNTEKPTETLNLDENEAMEILTASKHGADETAEKTEPEGKNESCDAISKTQNQREISTAETFLDDISDQNLKASSTLSVEEQNIVMPVSEATSEAPEKDKTLYGKEETPIVGETTEEDKMEKEDESTNPENDTKMESIEIEKESANDDAQNEDPELYTPPEVDNEKSISESDVELLNRVNTSEATNCGEMGKLETSEDKMPSDKGIEKDKSEYKTEVNEATKDVEADGGCTETDKDILEHEDSAKDFEGSSKNSIEIEKAPVEFEIEGHSHGSEASETKSISTLTEKDIETVEHGENHRSAPDSMVEDESNRRIPATNQANIPEESHDDENHTTDSTKEQISGQDIKEESTKMNEEIEPKLESQKEINKTQDTILNEKVPSEIERAAETEIIEEQTTQEESCTKELHMIPVADETVNEVRELDLMSIESLETTSSNNNTEMVKSKVEEDLNQESKAMNEDINEPIEKPVNVSSSVSEVSAEKIEEENIEDTENCDDNADTAPTVVTDVTNLGEFQLNGEPVEAIDTSSDAKNLEATKTADSSQHDAEVDSMKIEGISSIELQLAVHEHEKADNESTTLEKSDANDVEVEVEETKFPDESKDQDVKEIHETGTSLTVEETDANEIEKQIREVPEALPQPINQDIEADIGAEIISPTVATEVTNLGEVQLNDESVKVLDTSSDAKSLERTKTADDNQQDAEVDSLKLQETSSMVYQLPMQEHEKEDNASVTVEKSDANDVEAKETKIPETVPESKDQGIKETHETGTSLIVGVIDTNETEKQIGEVPEALSEPINKGVEAARDEEITLGQTLQAEKIEEPLQVPSSSLISEKQDSETTTTIEKSEDESTKKDDTQVDNLKREENSGMVSELPITKCESANNETVEKLDADEVEAKETETLEAVSESKDQGFQEIHETRTSPTTENTKSDKIEEGVDAVADAETSDHPHPVGKLEEQLQVSSSALNCETSTTSNMDNESTKKDETEVDKIEPEEATGMLSKSPTIEYENADADEVQVETKTYKAISESTGDDVEETHERIQPSTDTEDEENKGLEMPCDSTKDDYMSKDIACPDDQKTDKVIETSEAAGDMLDSSLFTAPIEDECSEKPVQDVKGNLEENSSMACEDGSQETVVLSEKMKDVTSIEDEVQNQNLESFFVKEVEDICLQKADSPETSKEESETGMKDIVNESQNEEDNRNDILENIVTPDTNLSTIGKDDENPEPKPDASFREPNESMRRESEDIIPTEELTTECQQEGFMVVAGEDNIVAAEQDQPETSNHKEHSEQSRFMQETEPAMANLGSPLDVASGEIETTAPNEYAETITNIKEQRMDGIPQKILGETREDEIKKDENPEGKNLSTVDLDEKTRSTEVEIPNKNDNELYVTHPTAEETVQLGVEKQDEVSMSESGDQLHEAFEVPTEEEKHVNETYKASKSPQSTILDHTSIGEALNMDVTSTTNELDINLEHGSELNSEKEVKEINAEETIKEEIEQKEKASDTEIQISTKSDDNERSTIEDDITVKNDTPLCTGEEDYHHDQEDKIGPNSLKEASIELDSGDQSCRTSSETKNVNDHIINEETIQEYEDPKITDRGEEAEKEMKIEDHTEMGQKLETTSKSEGIEKQVLAEESRDQDWPTVPVGEELGTESPQEDAMKTKTSKEEVLEMLQTADGSASFGIQTKEEDGTSKDNFVACDGEEIKNGYSCDKENEDKEPDTVVLEKKHGGQDTSEQIIKSSARNQSAESFLENTVRESSQEDEASEEYETAGASTTTEESAITDLHSSSVGEEKVQENLKEDKTEKMRSEKEASEKYKTAGASMTMEEISITDLPSSSVGEEEVQENLKEDKTETMRSEKEASKEYETAGVSMTMEESAITDLPSSSVREEKVQENLKEDKTEAMRSEKEACEEHETVEASTTMEKSAIIDLPSSFVEEEKVEENLKENKTEAMRSEKEARASTTIEASAITDLPSSSVGEEKVQENLKEDKTEEMRSEKEAIEEYETVGASTTMEESAITDLPSSSFGEEKVQENLKEDETEAMRSAKEASEEYETVGASTTMEESAITDLPSLSTAGEEKFQEYLKEGKTETMRSEQEASKEYETAGGSMTMEESTITDLPSSTVGEEKVQENLKEDETEAMRSEKEASEEYETAGGSKTMEESTITDLPSSTVGEGKVQENLKEDETEAMRSEKEVRNSNIECIERDFVTTLSTKEREANTLQDEAETNDGFNSESFTRSSEEETAKKESNLDLVENYSSVPNISEKEIKEEILEKEDSEATVAIEETSLTEAEVEHKMQADSSNMVSEEKGPLTTETSEMESNGIDTTAKTIETSNLGENKGMEIPTARKHGADEAAEKIEPEGKNETCDAISNTEDQREIATVETSLDDISEQNLQASSTTSLEEHNFLTPDVSETRVEAPEKDKTLYDNAETPIVAETTEENIMEKEDKSTNQINNTNVEPIEIEKESANDDAQNEDQESYTSPEMNNEKSTSESDIEILKSVSTSQIPDCSEIGKLETVEDEKLSDTGLEKDQSDYEMAVSEDSKGVEADGGCIETEKAIQEKEDSAMNFEENSKESVEIKKPQVEFEAGGHSHGTVASETKSISTLAEKVPREIERATESEIIEEQITEKESCTKEPQMIAVADETINEMRDLDLTPIQSLETTASNDNTEMVKSKLAEDLNQESEASSMKITMKDEIKKPIEKPVNVSSMVSEVSEEKFEEENIEDTENCDDNTNIAPTVLTDVTNLGEVQLNDKPVKALDTSSDAKSLEPATIADTSQHDAEVDSMKLESDANDVEAEGTKIPDSVSESKEQGVKEIHETDTSLTVGETETNEIDKQIREVPEALSEPLNQGVETASNDEIIAPTVAIEVTRVGKVQVNDEPVNTLDTSSDAKSLETTKAADIIQQDEEVDSMRPKEASTMVCQLPIHKHEKAGNEITVETSDANDDEVEELKISDAVPDSKDQCVKEFNETGTSLIMGETDANEIEKQIREVPEGLSEPINQGVEADRDDEITPGQTLQAEKIEEQLQEPSSSLISKEQDSETTTTIEKSEDGSTKKDDTQVDNLKPVESSGMVSELPITNCESANNETVEKLDADEVEVEVEETKTLDAVSESKDQGFEEIHETGTSQTTENALTDKIEQEIQEANEKISDPIYQGVDSVVDGETSDHPLPLGKLEYESTKEDETEIDNIELVEATGMLSKLPAIEHKNADMSATIEKADANEVQVEESKTSEAISESKVHGVEEIQEIGPSLTVGNTHTDKVEEIKEAPDTIFKPTYQCVEAVIDRDITINQTLPTQRNEQLQEPSSALPKEQNHETPTNVELIKDESTKKDETQPNENVACSFPKSITEKACLQDEGPRELDVLNLELKVQESQNKAPEEESIALKETSTVEPQEYIPEIKCADCPIEYEIIPIQCSSQGTSKDEDIINSGDSNKESDNLPPPYAAVKDLLQGEVGEMCEESSNLKFEKTAKVLESVSEIHSREVPPTSEGIEIIEEQLKGVITETRDGRNHSEETTEADEAIKKDTSNGKAIDEEHKQITEENPVARNSHPVSPHEETVTKSNQEDELRAEDYPGKRTNITFEIIENEIQHEEMFEESEEAGEDKYIKETITTEDKTFKDGKVSVGDGTANVSPPEEAEDGKNIEKVPNRLDHENQGDETNFEHAATEATAPIKEFKPSEVMLVSHEEDRTCDNDEETVMRNDEHLQNTDLVVPPVIDAAAEEAPDEKVRENFEEVSEPAPKGPSHRTIETYEENKEIASADTNNSENLMDNDKLESRFLQPACEESGVREDMNLKEQEVSSNIPSISSCAATSHEKIADKESEKTADKKDGFVSDKQTTEAVSILEQEKSIQFEEEHTKDEEPVELSTMGNDRKLDETKIHSTTTTNGDEETQYQNEKPNVLSHIKDSSREVSHEKGIMDLDKVNEITEGIQDLEKTSIAISQEQIARRANPTESAETTNSTASKDIPQMQDDPTTKIFQNPGIEDLKAGYASGFEPEAKGVECGEEKRMGEESEETTEKSVMIESAEFSFSDFMHGSRKQTLPVVEHLTKERELTGNKEEPQTESAERVQVEETKTEEGKDEYEEGDEHKRADSGSDAPVMVEASTDTDVKIVHKKHHNILSGVGSKVKHSLAKMKKAITGKSSHPKTPSAVK